MAVITAPGHREKQPHDVSGGAREHRTVGEERTGDRSEHGGASLLGPAYSLLSIASHNPT